jgi:ribonuclease HI
MSFIKLNTDGSVKGNPGPTGAGGLLRDDQGKWLWGFMFYMNLGHTTSTQVKLWEVREGLTSA